jgi:hypothetical protein
MDTESLSIKSSASNASESLKVCDEEGAESVAVSGWQLVREMLAGQPESDEVLRVRITFFKEIIRQVGPEKFIDAIKDAIRISKFRNEVTIARVRECAGLSLAPTKSPCVVAWELVTTIVVNHLNRNAAGLVVYEDKVVMCDGVPTVRPVPNIPVSVQKTVDMLGGWSSLWEAYATGYWGARFQQFREIYRP